MNKHTKIAILVAPVLAVLGFAATDMYSEHQAAEKRIFHMQVQGSCDINAEKCILKSKDFLLSFSNKEGKTVINSTYPLDTATMFLVDNNGQSEGFQLGMVTSPYYWKVNTNLSQLLKPVGAQQKVRIIANIKGGSYIGEFTSTTQ